VGWPVYFPAVTSLRRPAALLCVALILCAGLIPVAVALVPTPLIQLGVVIAAADALQPISADPTSHVSLRALVTSRHLARASLSPARS
jgi:hypothetical protein